MNNLVSEKTLNELNHIAIIMDGNGRWAQNRGKNRTFGHKKGAEVVRDITIFASDIKLPFLTLYAFSTENWRRPKSEVDFLMKLLDNYLKNELETYIKHNVRFEVIGDINKFSNKLIKRVEKTKEITRKCTGLTQILAINYGSKDEITRAVNKLIAKGVNIVTEADINKHLDTKNIPEVDMLIRTGGQKRLSNFLLWQSAYAELFFTKTLWPDFTPKELSVMIEKYKKIKRNFGGI